MTSCTTNAPCSKGYCCEMYTGSSRYQTCTYRPFNCYTGDGTLGVLGDCSNNNQCATDCCTTGTFQTCQGTDDTSQCMLDFPVWAIVTIVTLGPAFIILVVVLIICCYKHRDRCRDSCDMCEIRCQICRDSCKQRCRCRPIRCRRCPRSRRTRHPKVSGDHSTSQINRQRNLSQEGNSAQAQKKQDSQNNSPDVYIAQPRPRNQDARRESGSFVPQPQPGYASLAEQPIIVQPANMVPVPQVDLPVALPVGMPED